jgi:aspartyl protease family protein
MRTLINTAALLACLVTSGFQIADRLLPAASAQSSLQPTAVIATANAAKLKTAKAAPADLHRAEIPRSNGGQFLTEGFVGGQRLTFMVDTGASLVAVNETTANQLGMFPTAADYNSEVTTANGPIKAAHARLGVVKVGDVELHDVDALVLPDAALHDNLLGLSFLSRIKRMVFADNTMTLEQAVN